MTINKLKHILDLHGVPFKEKNGRVLADSMIAGTQIFERMEDVTDWSPRKLRVWLGYGFGD